MFGDTKNMGPHGETISCKCALCNALREMDDYFTCGGWCDPRRGYSESEEDFLKRAPDGFISWPKDHINYWEVEPQEAAYEFVL